MADLLIKIGSVSNDPRMLQDGDVVNAYNTRRILKCHADMICTTTVKKLDGLHLDDINKNYLELVSKYKFERLNVTDVKRTNLVTHVEDIMTGVPNLYGEYIDAAFFVKRRVVHKNHKIFGELGKEIWYHDIKLNINLDIIWNMIETYTDYRKNNFMDWDFSEREKKVFLALPVQDFDDVSLEQFRSPEYKQVGSDFKIVKKRKKKVVWDALSLPISVDNIRDTTQVVEIQKTQVQLDPNVIIENR